MILLFTDFGVEGPYLGQVEAVLYRRAPTVRVIHLVSNAPAGDPRLSSYLLAALSGQFPPASVFLCVVDPGVGGERAAVILKADERWFVGPDNGLLNTVAAQAGSVEWWIVRWRPQRLSRSFHGRDLFAPVAASIALGEPPESAVWAGPDLTGWSGDLDQVIYLDHYGNALTGRRFTPELSGKALRFSGLAPIGQAETFCEVPRGSPFWYRNSIGLVEVSVNLGSARDVLGLQLGAGFTMQ